MAVSFGNKMIESRKRADNAYRQMDAVMVADRKIFQMANFENVTANKIDSRMKREQFEKRKQEHEVKLHDRRQQLADLYNTEIESWRAQVLANVETLEDRQARIMERAYALRDAREKERMSLVKEKYDEQWRDACDDARTLDSKAMTKYMNKERIQQIQDKIKRKQQVSSQENSFLDEWNRQLEELERRDRDKQDLRRRIDHETSNEIKAQIEYNAQQRETNFYKSRQEEDDDLARLRMEIEQEETQQRKKTEDAYRRGRDVIQFNAENKRVKDSEAHIDRDHDAILLDYALRKEQAANQLEEAKRNANRQASMQYRKYLEEQMVKAAEDTAFVDDVRKREEEKVWKLRDDALQARQDARDYLMREVDQGRQQQISEKRTLVERERVEGQHFAAKFIDDAHDAVNKERLAADRRRQVAVDNNERLLQQIEYRKHKEELERQEAYLADKQMKYIERQHKERLAEQGGAIRAYRPLQKNNWYS